MPGEVTQVLLDETKSRLDKIEVKLSQFDDLFRTIYRLEAKIDTFSKLSDVDSSIHQSLTERVLKCEASVITLKAEMLGAIGEIEKKFLKWVAISAAISGGAGASVLKALSLIS